MEPSSFEKKINILNKSQKSNMKYFQRTSNYPKKTSNPRIKITKIKKANIINKNKYKILILIIFTIFLNIRTIDNKNSNKILNKYDKKDTKEYCILRDPGNRQFLKEFQWLCPGNQNVKNIF